MRSVIVAAWGTIVGFAWLVTGLDHYHNLPYCSPDNMNMMNASNGDFILQNDGSFRYQMRTCKLRKFKVKEAAECLKGQHLVFMGDSLSRYFYLDLAALFAFGKWPLHFVEQYHNGRSFLSEREYKSWSWFFEDTNLALNQGYHAVEVLDSYRNDTESFSEFIRTMYENRHFRYMPNGGLDDRLHDVRLSYIQWWGSMPMRGHKRISTKIPRSSEALHFLQQLNHEICPQRGQSFYPLTRKCQDYRKDNRQIDFPDFSHQDICTQFPNPTINPHTGEERCQLFERTVLQPMKTTHLILNIGWHSRMDKMGSNFLAKLSDAGRKYFDHPSTVATTLPRVTWRQCTKGAVFEGFDTIPLNFTLQHGQEALGYFAVGDITAKLKKIQDLLDDKNDERLKTVVKVNHHWPADKEVNGSSVHGIWHDAAHFEPYVYNEINNIFLNAICPLSVKESAEQKQSDAKARKVKRTKPGELPQEQPKFASATKDNTKTTSFKKSTSKQ